MKTYNIRKKSNMKSFLLKRLDRAFVDIENTYLKFNREDPENLPKGSEWLLDNFYMLELIYKETRANIIREKRMVLSQIEAGVYKEYPLVYALSLELINYFTGNISQENIIEFINGFQKWGILTLEEVSSISTCILIGLLEYIAKISAKLSTIDEIFKKEYILQSKYKISLGYGIKSIRAISNFDWENIFESIAVVEEIYSGDPLGIYENMDLNSKQYYRYNTKILAEKFNVEEVVLAKKILELTEKEWEKGSRDKRAHIGYYLIDNGRNKLFEFFGLEGNPRIHMKKHSYYYFPILLLGLFIASVFFIYVYNDSNIFLGILAFVTSFIPALSVSTNVFNSIFAKKYRPNILPKLEFENGIPDEFSTFVVIPTLLNDENRVEELMKNLEVHYLSNREDNIYFGIIGDFRDGDKKTMEEDEKIISKALESIEKLNKKYGENKFYYFHRERIYSTTQNRWMGWERKRGALVEFNDLLLGESTSFNTVCPDIYNLQGKIKYIITLDSDTKLPIDQGKKLIGTISHPLNRANIDKERNIVLEGYGIIQPRIIIDMDNRNKSLFTRIFADPGGIDPYSMAISDIYQDLFGEAIFTGKGIYDLEVFQKVLKKRIPENTVLSHDLLEGSYIRAGLATDIKLVDGYPEKYNSYIMRNHRWTRGDWQLIKWLYGDYGQEINSLSKWKIFDNLCRSSLSIFLLLMIFFAIILFPGNIYLYLSLVLLNILFPVYKMFLCFIFLPHEAIMSLDAIIRSIYRVYISNKNLLEWTTAFDMEKGLKNNISSNFIKMKENIIFPILLMFLTYKFNSKNLILAIGISLLWALGPIIAYIISKEDEKHIEISGENIELLQKIAKDTWKYYEDFANEKNNYLPPDNFQEYPYNGVANRTSPTNIGFYLISILASRDLGFINTEEMVNSIDSSIGTIEKMEKWEGHLYNWYNTESLKPLRPIFVSTVDSGNLVAFLIALKEGLKEYRGKIPSLEEKIGKLIMRIENLVANTKFKPLYDDKRNLFYIGYNVEDEKVLNSYYDLLASEARTTSYIAISRREVPLRHWNHLGKSLIKEKGDLALASWTGTMFEYLMPSLILRDYENTLIAESNKTAVRIQKDYGFIHNLPWGISESGFFAFDRQLNYQYKAFGIPSLGFKRGLREELVVSPYSSFLALKFDYPGVVKNIMKLESQGLRGEYGYYEAVDYTLSRLPAHLDKGIVKSYMSHHQGMILISINNLLNKDIMVNRFHRDPQMKTGELLLQERIPSRPIISKEKENLVERKIERSGKKLYKNRIYGKSNLDNIQCHILSSNTYSTMINNRGEGFSKEGNVFINRWRRDFLSTPYGQFIYIKDLKDNKIWSTSFAPLYSVPDYYNVEFSSYSANFHRKDGNIETKMEVFLLPEELGEIRRISLINNGEEEKTLETISYFEILGERLNSDMAHPAFNNLFIKTESLENMEGLLAYRRKRTDELRDSWILHGIRVFGEEQEKFQYETDRNKFIGRGNSLKNPNGVIKGLSNTTGVVLDPIMSIGKKIKIKPGEKVNLYYITAIAYTKEEAMDILNKYSIRENIIMARDLSNTKSQVEIDFLNLNQKNINFAEEILPHLFYLQRDFKSKYKSILKDNIKGKEGLWAHGISGDNPMVLISLKTLEGIENIEKILDAYEYWLYKGLKVDLIILNEEESNYHQPLFQNIREIIYEKGRNTEGIFLKNKNALNREDIALFYKWVDLVIDGERGCVLNNSMNNLISLKEFRGEKIQHEIQSKILELDYFNGYGGFSKKGSEYIIKLNENLNTPMPWINVIANKYFGFIATEMGTGFIWSKNSRENKLTPWYNDLIMENPGEIIYLRDNNTGEVFSITPSPIRDEKDYIITHGLGYSVFEHYSHGIQQELVVFVPKEDSIKVNLIKLKNHSNKKRQFSLFYYIRPVLGVIDEETENLLESQMDGEIFKIKNSTNIEFKNSTLFIGSSEKIKSYTGDRIEFMGSVPNYNMPEALKRKRLSNNTGFGLNPCGAIEIQLDLPANEERELVFLLGENDDIETGYKSINKYKDIEIAKNSLEEIKEFWREKLLIIEVNTPDPSMNYLMNNWLMYQTIVCRIWGRAGFYQVGGAFGARDQMQDTMNALYHASDESRRQIIENCKHQYREGDVQHWWHPIPNSEVHKGIRSKYTDDLLWLPLGVAEYILKTGDESILKEEIPFIESPVLREDEEERYEVPSISKDIGTVYEHCIRAIEKSLNFGERGLPLMGGGDWNDGMNKIGYKGQGESIWLGWFIITVLKAFITICESMGDLEKAEKYNKIIINLKTAIEENAWDGEWYRRAYFDNGTPIGSKENTECIIDSIAQSWSVISGEGDAKRIKIALNSVEKYLVNNEEGIIALLTPAFDNIDLDPGYIKSYVPGVRENGGQYTHAAIWVIQAFALLGEGDKAYELFKMINPINHSKSLIECAKYKVEPYVMAADVYTNPQHLGRGGWTWYTGSSGWMYKVGLENILGFRIEKNKLYINPCIPKDWEKFSIRYKYGSTYYNIEIQNKKGEKSIILDGVVLDKDYIDLVDDKVEHFIAVKI